MTPTTLYPWRRDAHPFATFQRASWPWVGGILVSCTGCRRTWYGNASMRRFNQIRDQLPEDGSAVEVEFEKLGKEEVRAGLTVDVVEGRVVRRLARPKPRSPMRSTYNVISQISRQKTS